jgi:hypothetical protein
VCHIRGRVTTAFLQGLQRRIFVRFVRSQIYFTLPLQAPGLNNKFSSRADHLPLEGTALDYLFLFIGLIGLFFGGEALVRGSIGIARRMAIPPLLIGLTVTAQRWWSPMRAFWSSGSSRSW